ncbi:MAG: hypothetical protein ACJ790_10275 [Myxococcaceae bacterium]
MNFPPFPETNGQVAMGALLFALIAGVIARIVFAQFKKGGSGRHFVAAIVGGAAVLALFAFAIIWTASGIPIGGD